MDSLIHFHDRFAAGRFGARRVIVSGEEVHLTPIEYRLLTTLIRHAGKVLTQSYLLKDVWSPCHAQESHFLRVAMAKLRSKIETDPAHPRIIFTEVGVGYRLNSDKTASVTSIAPRKLGKGG